MVFFNFLNPKFIFIQFILFIPSLFHAKIILHGSFILALNLPRKNVNKNSGNFLNSKIDTFVS